VPDAEVKPVLIAVFEVSEHALPEIFDQARADAEEALRAAMDERMEIAVRPDGRRLIGTTTDGRAYDAVIIEHQRPDRWSVDRRPAPYVMVPVEAASAWDALGSRKQTQIIDAAKRRQPWTDLAEARTALGWAWSVIGPPDDRVPELPLALRPAAIANELLTALTTPTGVSYEVSWVTKRKARAIEKANLAAGYDPGVALPAIETG
jgi:Xaa-Pro aminopeptidase